MDIKILTTTNNRECEKKIVDNNKNPKQKKNYRNKKKN